MNAGARHPLRSTHAAATASFTPPRYAEENRRRLKRDAEGPKPADGDYCWMTWQASCLRLTAPQAFSAASWVMPAESIEKDLPPASAVTVSPGNCSAKRTLSGASLRSAF